MGGREGGRNFILREGPHGGRWKQVTEASTVAQRLQ